MTDMFVKAITRAIDFQLSKLPVGRDVHTVRVFVHDDKRLEEVLLGLANALNPYMYPGADIAPVKDSRESVVVLNRFKEQQGIEVDVFLLPAPDPDHLYFRYDCKNGIIIFLDNVLHLPTDN